MDESTTEAADTVNSFRYEENGDEERIFNFHCPGSGLKSNSQNNRFWSGMSEQVMPPAVETDGGIIVPVTGANPGS